MWQRILLPALLVVGLVATVGVASASIGADDSTTSVTIDDSTSTTAPSGVVGSSTTSVTFDDSVTSTTLDDGDDDDSVTSTTLDDGDDDDSATSTTIAGDAVISDGLHVIDAGDAGTITIEVRNGALSIVSIDIDGQWTRTETEQSSREISVEFENGSSELEIEAEIENGQLETRVRFEHDDDHSGNDDHSGDGD